MNLKWCPVCKLPSEGKNFCPLDGSRLVDVPPDTPMPAADLIVETPGLPRRTIKIATHELSIGKGPENDLVILDPTVSQHHALVRRSPEGIYVVDLGSRNGVRLNGKRIGQEPVLVKNGDELKLGQTRLQFELESASRGTALVSSRDIAATVKSKSVRPTSVDEGPGYLTLVLPTGEVQRFPFDRTEFTIGKGAGNDIVVEDPAVSRSHATLRWENGEWLVFDHGSKNGSFVNERRVSGSYPLRPGDVLLMGRTQLSIVTGPHQPGSLESTATANSEASTASLPRDSGANFRVARTGRIVRVDPAAPRGKEMPILLDGRYELREKLAQGASGTVYSAFRTMLTDMTAVKVLRPDLVQDPVAVERYRRGAHVAARIKHRNSLQIFDFGIAPEGAVYIVMELLSGRTLRDVVRESGALEVPHAVELFTQIADATAAANAEGIILRNMKPESIFIERLASGRDVVKVGGYGFAKLDTSKSGVKTLGAPAKMLGAPHYMPPEQWLDLPLDPRSNVYALAVLLFEMLTGHPPFEGASRGAIADKHLNAPPPDVVIADNWDLSNRFTAIMRRALAKEPAQRYASPTHLARDVKMALRS
jgi:eukaryotic-like serine/threonine-protein kinase